MLDIGICGKPNSGKSTFFSAATMVDVAIADYPFTTIDANRGVAYVRAECPCKGLGKKCNPRNSKCVDGTRLVPITIIDVAGLVPGAYKGKGLGNKFLDDLRNASVIIQVVDASGKTDLEGKPAENADPAKEIEMLGEEIVRWMAGIILRGAGLRKKLDAEQLAVQLSGLGIGKEQVAAACDKTGRTRDGILFESEEEVVDFAGALRKVAKPTIIAANKADIAGAEANCERLERTYGEEEVVRCFAEGELALRKAEKAGLVKYTPGDEKFEMVGGEEKQREALGKIAEVMKKNGGTGVQQALNRAAFGLLGLIVVYPVEDVAGLSDSKGNVLPDAVLLKKGSTPLDLARAVHTDLAEKFICAIDVRKGMKVGKEHELKDGDVLKIVIGR